MNLNDEQQKAVDHKEGPLLIVAGAGTGKTRVITSRILSLIKAEECKLSEILALTFTEKAASEMVERIDESMPLSYEEICVKTFHGFCEKLLREAGLEIGIDPGYKILTQVEQWFFFKKNLFKFDLNYYRPLGNPNRFIYTLLGHFSKLKDELVEPDAYIEYAKKIEGEDGEKMLEVAKAYKKYQELMMENNFLDFGDLIFYSLRLLKQRESVLSEYSKRFKYILVDEFQDTNYSQYALVKLLAHGHSNLVVVGDDDQSIYKWRGASLSNILQFEQDFSELKKIVLNENYRSTKKILDAAYGLIQNNNPNRLEAREGISKQLKSNLEGEADIECHSFPNFIEEAEFVAKEIKRLHDEDGVSYGEMAILVRANQQAHPFIDALKALKLPYQVKDPRGLLMLEEIKDLISVARFLANPYDDISVLRILKMDVFGVEMSDILKMLHSRKNDHLINAIRDDVNTDNLSIPGTEEGLKKVSDLLENLIQFSKKGSVGEVFNEFLTKSGYLDFLVSNDKFEEMYHINEFAKHVAKFERNHSDKSVIDFVEYLNLLEESNSPMPSDVSSDRDSVQILTVHGSKGLEFECVFSVSLVKNRFPAVRRRETFEIPAELTNEILPEGDVHVEEERRLMYVAVTRAKKRLYLTFSALYEGSRVWKRSPFVDEILEQGGKLVEHEESPDVVRKLQDFQKPAEPIFELPEFKVSRLSYSQLDTFNTCPLKYNYRYLLKVPVAPSHAANFGTSVHEALNEFYIKLKKGEEVSFDIMQELYEKHWLPYGYESAEHEDARKKQGLKLLKEFFEANSSPWVKPAHLERPFNLKIGKYWFMGRIDRIDKLEDGTYEVIDYKTGSLKEKIDVRTNLQLSLYAMAARDVFKINVSKLSLYYLDGNQKLSVNAEDLDLGSVQEKIEEMVNKMESSDFAPTPGYLCNYCDYRLICPAV